MIRVLIADDHAIVRDGLRLILETHGEISVVGETTNGMETVKLAKVLVPDVVIMDIQMPELNGIEATRQILAQNPSVRVLILSMHSTVEDIYRSLKAGATGYLLKESAGSEVIQAVLIARTGKRYLSRKVDDILIDSYIQQQDPAKVRGPLESLSAREREVLQLVAEGKSSSEIAARLYLSVKTIETYRSRLMQKLNLKDIPALVRFALANGLI